MLNKFAIYALMSLAAELQASVFAFNYQFFVKVNIHIVAVNLP